MFRRTRPTNAFQAHRRMRRVGAVAAIATAAVIGVATADAAAWLQSPSTSRSPHDHVDEYTPTPTISVPPPVLTGPAGPLPGDDDGPVVTGPVIPLPGDDDGPIFTGPIIPLPDDGPIFEGPLIPLPGGDDPAGSDPTVPPSDAPAGPVDPADPADPGPGTQPGGPSPETAPPASADPGETVAPFLEIISATVDCAGVVHVTYETGAVPEPAAEGEHVVMFSPSTDPTAVVAHRIAPRPINSVFTVDMQSGAPGAYRVYVVADFEPAVLDGILLVDEADATAPADCPAAPTTTALPPGPTSVAPSSG